MYNVFKEPITCELKPSYKLATGFLAIAVIPILSSSVLFHRFTLMMIVITIVILTTCVHLIIKYAIRWGGNAVMLLRLHKNTALITYNNRDTKLAIITKICVSESWVILQTGKGSEKVILDQCSVGQESYSHLRRQINAFKTH